MLRGVFGMTKVSNDVGSSDYNEPPICANVCISYVLGHVDTLTTLSEPRLISTSAADLRSRIAGALPTRSLALLPPRPRLVVSAAAIEFAVSSFCEEPELRALQGLVRSLDMLSQNAYERLGYQEQAVSQGRWGRSCRNRRGGVDGTAVVGEGTQIFVPRSGDAGQLAVDCGFELDLDGVDERFRARFADVVGAGFEAWGDGVHGYADGG